MHEDMLCALLLPASTTAAELFKSLNDYVSGKLNWSFCVRVYMDGAAAMTGCLSGFTTRVKEVASECESTHCVIHREMLASRKMSPELSNILQDVIKIINHGAFLVVQWLGVCLPMQGTRVRALVWEYPICRGATKRMSHNY